MATVGNASYGVISPWAKRLFVTHYCLDEARFLDEETCSDGEIRFLNFVSEKELIISIAKTTCCSQVGDIVNPYLYPRHRKSVFIAVHCLVTVVEN